MLAELLAAPPASRNSDGQIDREDLLVYIEAELNGRDAAQLYPQVRLALDHSAQWQQEYAELKEFLLLLESDTGRAPPRAPYFDLSYLPAPIQPAPTSYQPVWHWEKLSRLVIEFSTELLQNLQVPRPQPAYVFERSGLTTDGNYQFALENTVEDLNVRINIQRLPQANDHYQLVVETEIPSRGGWPHLANTVVNLKQANAVVQSRLTDAFGKAVFNEVASPLLAQLTVEIVAGQSVQPPAEGRQSE